MLKKLLLLSTCLLPIASLAANNGFYLGAQFGRDNVKMKQDVTSNANGLNETRRPLLAGYTGNIHLGYAWLFNPQFGLNSELFYGRSSAEAFESHSNPTLQAGYQKKQSFGVSLLPQWQIDANNALYLRLGWIRSTFNRSHVEIAMDDTVTINPFSNHYANGIETGLGLATNLANQWKLRFEYDHTRYNSFSRNNSTGNISYQPNDNQFTLGVDYYFNSQKTKHSPAINLLTHGIYLGLGVGYGSTNYELEGTSVGNTFSFSQNYNPTGFLANIHLGYSWQLAPHWALGSEIFAIANSAQANFLTTTNTIEYPTTYKQRRSFGIAILPGYKLTNSSLVYLRIGAINTKFENVTPYTTFLPSSVSTARTGVQTGLGYEVAVSHHWSIYLDYNHDSYPSYRADAVQNNRNQYELSDNLYSAGINYRF